MRQGLVSIFGGEGHGKSSAALGRAILAAASGRQAFIIRFLKGKEFADPEYFRRLEPEIKIFSFERSNVSYRDLSQDKKTEEIANIRNGLHFAKKVLTTGECDLLILDEILGLIDNNIITVEELGDLLAARDEETDVILTGIHLNEEICRLADEVSQIDGIRYSERYMREH